MSWTRRAMLASLGAAALPIRSARAAGTPRRVVFFFVPNGAPDHLWRPSGLGTSWSGSPILDALTPIRSEVAIYGGLSNLPDDAPLDHLTACRISLAPRLTNVGIGGSSVDHLIADALEGQTPMRALHLANESGPCAPSKCQRLQHISWSDLTTPNPLDRSVTAAWRRLFGASARPFGRSALAAWARDDLARFRARDATDDARRIAAMDQAMTEAETPFQQTAACVAPAAPLDAPTPLFGDDDHVRAMLDLSVTALSCDLTRVVTYMLGNGASIRPLTHLGLGSNHHELSHSDRDDAKVLAGQWAVGHFVHLVQSLAAIPADGGTRLLDHTMVVYLSDMGDGNAHARDDIPVLVAGGAAMGMSPGYVPFVRGTPLANLYVSLLRAFGVDGDAGYEATGPLLALDAP